MNTQQYNQGVTSIFTIPLIRFILFVVLILLIIYRYLLPAALIIILSFTLGLARFWSKIGLKKLEIKRRVYPCRMFPGEETTLTVEVNNNKWVPINLRCSQAFDPGLTSPDIPKEEPEQELSFRRYLGWYDRYCCTFGIKAAKRGFYRLRPLLLEASDGLGLFKSQETRDDQALLIVYPRLCEIKELELTAADLIGERKDNRPLLPDPLRIAGLRDYTPDIPARFIHWKASAHKDDLLAKVMEPTADIKICVAVDVETFCSPVIDAEAFEEALSVAASLVYWAEGEGIPFGLLANGTLKELSCPGVVPIGSSTNHINVALETLARLELTVQGTLSDLIKTESARLPWGTTLVIVGKDLAADKTPVIKKAVYYNICRRD